MKNYSFFKLCKKVCPFYCYHSIINLDKKRLHNNTSEVRNNINVGPADAEGKMRKRKSRFIFYESQTYITLGLWIIL